MNRFEKDCLEFLKTGRREGMFNTGHLNINAVMGCCIQYAQSYAEFGELTLLYPVLAACERVKRAFVDWVLEGN